MILAVAARSPRLAAICLAAAFGLSSAAACDPSGGGRPSPAASASAASSARRPHLAPRSRVAPNGEPEPCDPDDEEGCREACKNGIGRACYDAAMQLMERGDAEERRAIALLEEGCKLRSVESCLTAADRLTLVPELHGEPFSRARWALERGCELGSVVACRRAEKALLGVDVGEAKQAHERLCAKDPACAPLDVALYERADKARAACEAKDPAGCAELGHALRGADEARRLDAYRRACSTPGLVGAPDTARACVQWLRGVGEAAPSGSASGSPSASASPSASPSASATSNPGRAAPRASR